MVVLQSVCLRKLGQQRSGEVRFGRWIRNWRVSVKALIDGVCGGITARVAGRHVLLLEDTSEINYQTHAGRTQGLGKVGNGKDVGLFLHPVLAIDAQDHTCLGLAHPQESARRPQAAHRGQGERALDRGGAAGA